MRPSSWWPSSIRPQSAAVAIIKHANPCGVAVGATPLEAYAKAFRCDPVSPYGGIIALNRPIDAATAVEVTKILTEIVIAPDASAEAKAIFARKKNLRLLTIGDLPDPRAPGLTFRSLAGGFLVQSRDNAVVDDLELKVVTKRQPTPQELADLKFAFRVAKHVKSNAIVYARDGATVGIGAGQMSRVDSSRIAAWKSLEATKAAGLSRAAGQGLGGGLRRVLPVRRRPAGGRRGRRHGRDPARRLPARQRGDRSRRQSRPRHGLHRRAPLPPLTRLAAQAFDAGGGKNVPRHIMPSSLGSHSEICGTYVTTTRKHSIVSSHGHTAMVSSVMPILAMPEAT